MSDANDERAGEAARLRRSLILAFAIVAGWCAVLLTLYGLGRNG